MDSFFIHIQNYSRGNNAESCKFQPYYQVLFWLEIVAHFADQPVIVWPAADNDVGKHLISNY